MSTSGSTNFTQTRDQIITDSLVLLGVYGQGDTVTSADLSFCSNILNKMVKAWECQGIHLWTEEEGAMFFNLSQQVYSVSSSSSTDYAGSNVVFNQLDSNGSGSSLIVRSTIGITVSDYLGVVLDNGTIQWSTVSSIDSSTQLTMNASLSSSSSAGNSVFTFTTRVDRPLALTSTRYRTGSGVERPIKLCGRREFMNLPNKEMTGPTNQCFYSPKVSSAKLYIWPTADDVNDCITFSYLRRIEDFDSSSDNPDLPQEALEAITYNLAVRVASSYGISTQKLNPDITIIAMNSLQELELWDSEEGSLMIVNDYRYD